MSESSAMSRQKDIESVVNIKYNKSSLKVEVSSPGPIIPRGLQLFGAWNYLVTLTELKLSNHTLRRLAAVDLSTMLLGTWKCLVSYSYQWGDCPFAIKRSLYCLTCCLQLCNL